MWDEVLVMHDLKLYEIVYCIRKGPVLWQGQRHLASRESEDISSASLHPFV